jgi:hydrogenase expression/formation protein HypE
MTLEQAHDTSPRTRDAEQQVLDRIERVRRRGPRLIESNITLPHGAGGKASRALVEHVFVEAFDNPVLAELSDAAAVTVGTSDLALTTDSFVVSPLFFPGGDIGELAVNGTVNDLAVSGARPLYLAAGLILEEGFEIAAVRRIAASMAAAAARAGVQIVTGDTKVVQRGKADGCYINTTGVGWLDRPHRMDARAVRPGDVILVSGPIGDHGVTILLARGELDIDADLVSDTAPLHAATAALLDAARVRVMRDATRGGVATVLNEIAEAAGVSMVLDEAAVPVRPAVTGACELLGIDPLYVACEGRFVAVVDPSDVEDGVRALRAAPGGEAATVIGEVRADPPGLVLARTAIGGTRIVDTLVGDPLPRIC